MVTTTETAPGDSEAGNSDSARQVLSGLAAITAWQEEFYRNLHQHPELGHQETTTAASVAAALREYGFTVREKIGTTGVVGVLKNGDGPVVLMRADMDALPIAETTGLPYASTDHATDGDGNDVPVMHACGHDVHVTCISGVARAMVELKDKWKGTLVLIGQPAEEVGKGAMAMLQDGLFTRFPRPDWCLALHVDAEDDRIALDGVRVGPTRHFGPRSLGGCP